MAKKQKQNNYLAACQKFGIDPKVEPKTETYPGEVHDYHYHVLRVCVTAENSIQQEDGSFKAWENKKDGTEYGYIPYLYKSGSGWAYDYCGLLEFDHGCRATNL